MTSKKVMLSGALWRRGSAIVGLAMAAVLLPSGCGLLPEREPQPRMFSSPYPAPKLWAVAPFRNESGTSEADGLAMADRLTQQLQQVDGIDALPVNRVLQTMEARRIGAIDSVDRAMTLMQALGVDGLIVGTITAWDPYKPPKIGAQVQLYSRRAKSSGTVDPRALTSSAGLKSLPGVQQPRQPIAQAGGYFDAANGKLRRNLKRYAHGRAPTDSPAGWRRYLISVDLYSEFVSHELMRKLFSEEWRRLTRKPNPAGEDGAQETGPVRTVPTGEQPDR